MGFFVGRIPLRFVSALAVFFHPVDVSSGSSGSLVKQASRGFLVTQWIVRMVGVHVGIPSKFKFAREGSFTRLVRRLHGSIAWTCFAGNSSLENMPTGRT